MEMDKMMVARLPPIGSIQAQHVSPRHTNKYEGLTGPGYSISGKSQKYKLPPPHVLKPYQDTNAGGLETWPAHATGGSNTSIVLAANNQLVVVDEEALGKAQMVPKPRFLEQLESFLKKELKSLAIDEVGPSELRLQAYREVFEYLIEDFKTYKPLLSAIKNEYEMMLSYQRQHIRHMQPLKQMLVTVSEQCDQKIMSLRDQEKQDILDLRQENKRLYGRIDELRHEQTALETQVERLQEELAAEYLRYRDECDARKLLIADINDLRYQQEDMMMAGHGSAADNDDEKDDPVTLKIALKKAREDEAAATARLNEIEANYGDVIPRRDYEALEKQYKVLEEHMEQFKGDFVTLQGEHNTLIEVNKQVLQQRDDYYVESETLRRSATPRPTWEKCADVITGGAMRWQELSEGKRSEQLVDVLLAEIAGGGGPDAGGAEYFEGQGTGPSVPKYLQYEGKVRNRRLGKRDTALLVRDIWREKGAHDAEKTDGKRDRLSDFLHEYLKRRFGLEQMVVEWAYNLHDACQRYQHDENIALFWQALTEEVDEEVYHQHLLIIAKLLNQLTKLDVDKGNQGALSRAEFDEVLREVFSGADDDSVAGLLKAADTELELKEDDEEASIDYKNLFMEDDEGKTGAFLEEVKKYILNEKTQYVEDIKKALGTTSPVTVDELKVALTSNDKGIDVAEMNRILCWAYRVDSPDRFPECEAMEQSALIARLHNGYLRRVGSKL